MTFIATEDKLRERLRLMIGIKLALLPRGVKHGFWRQAQPQNEQATKAGGYDRHRH